MVAKNWQLKGKERKEKAWEKENKGKIQGLEWEPPVGKKHTTFLMGSLYKPHFA